MRKAIRDKLLEVVPALEDVLQPHMPTAKTAKPFSVVKAAEENPSTISMGFDVPVEIWAYEKPTTFASVDKYVTAIVSGLNRKELTTDEDFRFALEYNGTIGSERYDEEWDAIGIGLSFSTVRIRR